MIRFLKGCFILWVIFLWMRVLFLQDAMVELDRRIKVLSTAVMYLKEQGAIK